MSQLCSFRTFFHDHFLAFDPESIKRVKRLAKFMQNKICNVNNIIDGTNADGFKEFLSRPEILSL